MKIFGCHGNELPIKEILYQSVFGDKYYMIGHKFTISVTMDVSPFAWCLARAVLKCLFGNILNYGNKTSTSIGTLRNVAILLKVQKIRLKCISVIFVLFLQKRIWRICQNLSVSTCPLRFSLSRPITVILYYWFPL